jgi:hypothetical protein
VSDKRARRRKSVRRSAPATVAEFDIVGEPDEYTVAALRLEMNELARRFGVTITTVSAEPLDDAPSG